MRRQVSDGAQSIPTHRTEQLRSHSFLASATLLTLDAIYFLRSGVASTPPHKVNVSLLEGSSFRWRIMSMHDGQVQLNRLEDW